MTSELHDLYRAMTSAGQPRPFFDALDAALQERIGHVLVTLLAVDGDEIVRIHSSRPEHFPVAGRKRMMDTPWGRHVIGNRRSFLAPDLESLRRTFSDHAVTEGLGGGSQINVPVVYDDRCIGTLNLTGREHAYGPAQVSTAESFAPALVPVFLLAAA